MTATLTDLLRNLSACSDAVDWSKSMAFDEAAWLACDRGDWLGWLVSRVELRASDRFDWRRRAVLAGLECTEIGLLYFDDDDDGSRALYNSSAVLVRTWLASDTAVARRALAADAGVMDKALRAQGNNYDVSMPVAYTLWGLARLAEAVATTSESDSALDVVAEHTGDAVANTLDAMVPKTCCWADPEGREALRASALKQCAATIRKHFTFEEVAALAVTYADPTSE